MGVRNKKRETLRRLDSKTLDARFLNEIGASDSTEDDTGVLGMFGNVFESTDTFTGTLIINLTSGKVEKYEEKFYSQSTAADVPRNAGSDAAPDVLKLGFTKNKTIEAVN